MMLVAVLDRDVQKTKPKFGSDSVLKKPNCPKILTSVQTVFQ